MHGGHAKYPTDPPFRTRHALTSQQVRGALYNIPIDLWLSAEFPVRLGVVKKGWGLCQLAWPFPVLRTHANVNTDTVNETGLKLLYSGFETCFAPSTKGAAVR